MLVADSETTLDRFCNKRNIALIEKDNALYTKDDIPKVVKIQCSVYKRNVLVG